jgi:hypothetical protein
MTDEDVAEIARESDAQWRQCSAASPARRLQDLLTRHDSLVCELRHANAKEAPGIRARLDVVEAQLERLEAEFDNDADGTGW